MNYLIIASGNNCTICALVLNNTCQVTEFIDGLDRKDSVQISALFNHIADQGTHNEEKMRNLGDKIYELKTRGGIRFLSFWSKNRHLILTHGFHKPPNKVLIQEKKKAISIYEKFIEDEKKGNNREVSEDIL